MASYRSFVCAPVSLACTAAASAAVIDLTPCLGSQWYLTSFVSPSALTHL
jgi:hypothetical protein